MEGNEVLNNVGTQFKNITRKTEHFLEVQHTAADKGKEIIKLLYDFSKLNERNRPNTKTLTELLINNVDEEQIWQQLSLQNDEIESGLVKDMAFALAKKDSLTFTEAISKETNEIDSGSNISSFEDDDSANDNDLDALGNDDFEESDDESNDNDANDSEPAVKFTSEVDDEFFKLCEMENFCEAVEKEKKDNLGIDLFGMDSDEDDDEDENRLIRYKDFFAKNPETTKKAANKKNTDFKSKKVTFETESDMVDDNNDQASVGLPDSLPETNIDSEPKSNFEDRQHRLKARIATLEDEALKEKAWHQKGEVTSTGRPQNSLLEEYVEFDVGARSAPVFTEKTTLRLEDVIKQRVKDKAWDDVSRKVKPVESIFEYKKQLVLDQEKSKVSLAEIYEQAYVKQRDAANENSTEPKEEAEPAEHTAINKMMRSLFTKLDALSNFHYTPKPVAPDIRIISNVPAVTMEEVAPIATSDAALLAPEEVKNKSKGEMIGLQERSKVDKKRDRRKKKLKQRVRQKEKLKKENSVKKLSLGLGNKYSKEKAERTLDKLTKERNIDKLIDTNEKRIKSSSAFFSKLDDEVKINMKRKNSLTKKTSTEKYTAKRIKL